jgi:hypothetical protein
MGGPDQFQGEDGIVDEPIAEEGVRTDDPDVDAGEEKLASMETLIEGLYGSFMVLLRSQGMQIEAKDIVAYAWDKNCENVLQLAEHIFAIILNTLESIPHNMRYLHATPASEKIATKFLSVDLPANEKMSTLLTHHGKLISDYKTNLIPKAQEFLDKLAAQIA